MYKKAKHVAKNKAEEEREMFYDTQNAEPRKKPNLIINLLTKCGIMKKNRVLEVRTKEHAGIYINKKNVDHDAKDYYIDNYMLGSHFADSTDQILSSSKLYFTRNDLIKTEIVTTFKVL